MYNNIWNKRRAGKKQKKKTCNIALVFVQVAFSPLACFSKPLHNNPPRTHSIGMNRTASLLNFLNASPSPHHAVETVKQALLKAGFVQLFENDNWKDRISPSGKYFITRNGTSIVAMTVERDYVSCQDVELFTFHSKLHIYVDIYIYILLVMRSNFY